jgi:uncharacterized protein (DUF4213/DUF364 family)
MALLEELITSVEIPGHRMQEVVTGRYWSLVAASQTETGRVHYGLAPIGGSPDSISLDPNEAPGAAPTDSYIGRPTAGITKLALSDNALEASVGMATLNAVIAGRLDPHRFRPGRLPRATGKRVVLVGEFPFAESLRSMAKDLRVVEEIRDSNTYENTGAERFISEADIVLIRGSAALSRSLESLLELAGSCLTILYGPSTPLSPVLFEYGADQLVGVRVRDEEAVRHCIAKDRKDMMKCPGIESIVLARS